jgi:hypothetical protein
MRREKVKSIVLATILLSVASPAFGTKSCKIETVVTDAGVDRFVKFGSAKSWIEFGVPWVKIPSHIVAARPIDAIFFVIEFTDVNGKRMFSSVFYSTVNDVPGPIVELTQEFPIREQLETPLEGNSAHSFISIAPVRSRSCPQRGKLAFMQLSSANEVVFKTKGINWKIDPLPAEVDRDQKAPFNLSEGTTLMRLKLTKNGQVNSSQKQPVGDFLAKRWRFQPAYSNGEPLPSEVLLAVRVSHCSAVAPPIPTAKLPTIYSAVNICLCTGRPPVVYYNGERL